MKSKQSLRELFVYMNAELVGILRYLANNLQFTYEQNWLQSKKARPISLSMPLTESTYKGDVVYNFFDNLLPDNESIRTRIQIRFGAPTNQCFDLLSYIGADCVGALQLLTQPQEMHIQKIDATPINNHAIATLLKQYQTAPLGMNVNSNFRISIAGAQEKTALLWYKDKWHLPQGPTPTTHIIKLPIGYITHSGIDLNESVENEWLCLKLLSLFGLPVNHATITHFEDVKTLVVERFDRVWAENNHWLIRLPQEDMCQVLGKSSNVKYESDGGPGIADIMGELRGAHDAKADRKQFMKSVFLFWILGAIDGHAKNFSIAIKESGRYQLTPLYDVMSAYPIASKRQLEWKELKMAMSLKSKNRHYLWYLIQMRHWLAMANYCQFPEAEMKIIIEEVHDTMNDVIETASNLLPPSFPLSIAETIFKGMQQVKKRCNLHN